MARTNHRDLGFLVRCYGADPGKGGELPASGEADAAIRLERRGLLASDSTVAKKYRSYVLTEKGDRFVEVLISIIQRLP